jgi:hypothetical protein
MTPTDDWQQLRLLLDWPEQVLYELIRPVVLFGFTPGERAEQTGTPERTLRRRARRFESAGKASLFADTGTPRTDDPVIPSPSAISMLN